jgi:uncharacterized protein
MAIPADWQKKSREQQKQYRQLLAKANKNKVLAQLPDLHEAAFQQIDCLDCGNCCRNHSPRFKTTDIKRISRHLGLRESVFIDQYLQIDEDGDYVLQTTPCSFLNLTDNTCQIYDQRPGDCARFPYTDEDVLIKRPQITMANSLVCPAVHHVLEALLKIAVK